MTLNGIECMVFNRSPENKYIIIMRTIFFLGNNIMAFYEQVLMNEGAAA